MLPLLGKLTQEERELFLDIPTNMHNVYAKVLSEISADITKRMVQYNLSSLSNESVGELALLKAQTQGATLMLTQLQALRNSLRKK